MCNERRFYTYAYLRRDGTPYYVGKGSGRRAFDKNKHCVKVPPKERILFLKTGLTEKEAFKHEIYMIAVFGRKDLGTGILRNLTGGGEGPSNPCEEVRKKMRENGKISMLKRQKAVELTRMSDGAVFVFDCASDACRAFSLDSGALSEVCNGRQGSTRGFLARYWTSDVLNWGEGLHCQIKEAKKKKEKISKKRVELTRISDGAVFIFDSVGAAARALNLNPKSLSAVSLGKRKSTEGYTARPLAPTSPEP